MFGIYFNIMVHTSFLFGLRHCNIYNRYLLYYYNIMYAFDIDTKSIRVHIIIKTYTIFILYPITGKVIVPIKRLK